MRPNPRFLGGYITQKQCNTKAPPSRLSREREREGERERWIWRKGKNQGSPVKTRDFGGCGGGVLAECFCSIIMRKLNHCTTRDVNHHIKSKQTFGRRLFSTQMTKAFVLMIANESSKERGGGGSKKAAPIRAQLVQSTHIYKKLARNEAL